MKFAFSMLIVTGSLLVTTLASATTSTYQFCSDSNGTATCQTGGSATVTSSYARTKYPLVMAHGMAGFTAIGGLSIGQYFYGINSDLTANGARVFDTQVASFDSSTVRGEQLLTQVQQILAITGAQKVNLIGHSQGVLDSRYVAAVIPNSIATVTGVGGPNLGSPVADDIQKVTQVPVAGSILTPIITAGINGFFELLDISSGQRYSNSSLAGLNQLTSAGMATFNAQYPAGLPANCGSATSTTNKASNGVTYYSWGGTSLVTNPLDISDAFLLLTGALIPGKSDGLVGQCSSHLGWVLNDNYPQNHLDEVNLLFGLTDIFATSPVVLYRNQANRLQQAGF